MIQATFNIDPAQLQLTAFAELHAKSIYLEKRRLKNDAGMLEVLLTNQAELITELLYQFIVKDI